MNKLITLFLSLFFASSIAAAQERDFSSALTTISDWQQSNPVEKVYLQTDKPYYVLGDTIWFKAYVVQGADHRLSETSGALYADLLSETDSLVTSLKLPVLSGMAKGCFALPLTLPGGNYRIRSYTQWMRNAGPWFFYDHLFAVGDAETQGVEVQASLLTRTEGKKEKKYIRLLYRNALSGGLLTRQRVSYALRVNNRVLTDKATTEENGVLLVDLNNWIARSAPSWRIETEINTEQKIISKSFLLKNDTLAAEVAFFPEGGTLVNGIRSRVAVKVTGTNARGMEATGEVSDETGETLATWKTEHAGMGMFELEPQAGHKYTATVTYSDGRKEEHPLPLAEASGQVLSVYTDIPSDSVLVRIFTTPDHYGKAYLSVQDCGEIVCTAAITASRPLVQTYLPRGLFHSGVAQFTLLNEHLVPVAERLAFIQKADTLHLAIEAEGQQQARGLARLWLKVQDKELHPSGGRFSVSVTDETRVPSAGDRENDIFTELLLRSDLRGYIEEPAYYFRGTDDIKQHHLDLLLMSQGFRRYVWKDLQQGNLPSPEFDAEGLIQSISGRLVSLTGKPVVGGKITLLCNIMGVKLDTLTNNQGYFRFDKLIITDSLRFSIQGRTAKGGDKVELLMDETPYQKVTPGKNAPDMLPNVQRSLAPYLGYVRKRNDTLMVAKGSNLLKEVEVKRRRNSYMTLGSHTIPRSVIDHIIKPNNSDSCQTLFECIKKWLPSIQYGFPNAIISTRVENNIRPIKQIVNLGDVSQVNSAAATREFMDKLKSLYGGKSISMPKLLSNGVGMMVYYNDYIIGDDDLWHLLFDKKAFDPDVIKAIYIKEYTGTGMPDDTTFVGQKAFLYIETKDGSYHPPAIKWDITVYKPKGYSHVREYYSPRYDRSEEESRRADYRSTIYWNPDISATNDGNAKFEYFNAGASGVYKVIVEGLNSSGQLGRTIYRYKVVDERQGGK